MPLNIQFLSKRVDIQKFLVPSGMKKRTRTPKRRSAKKKTLGRYASSIEKYCADQLKEYGLAFDYEEHQFELMEKFKIPQQVLQDDCQG